MYIVLIIVAVCVLVADLLMKWLTVGTLFEIIPNVLEIRYSQNTGIAWGIGAENSDVVRWLVFAFGCLVVIGAIIFFIFYKNKTKVLTIGLALFIAGTVGNLVDRAWLGYVRDFIYLKFINFPIFNIADMAICFGVALIMWHILFQNKRKNANG